MSAVETHDIRQALHRFFGWKPGRLASHIILEEVANATGGSRVKRYADMVAISIWPSRGLSITGVEIKVSRSDWQREIDDPSKADAFSWCDCWYVAAPRGLITAGEIPAAWGLMEMSGAGKMKIVKSAPHAERDAMQPISRHHLITLLHRTMDIDHNPVLHHRVEVEKEKAREAGGRAATDDALRERVRELEGELATAERRAKSWAAERDAVVAWERETGVFVRTGDYHGKQELLAILRLMRELRAEGWMQRRDGSRLSQAAQLARSLARDMGSLRDRMSRIASGVEVLVGDVAEDTRALIDGASARLATDGDPT